MTPGSSRIRIRNPGYSLVHTQNHCFTGNNKMNFLSIIEWLINRFKSSHSWKLLFALKILISRPLFKFSPVLLHKTLNFFLYFRRLNDEDKTLNTYRRALYFSKVSFFETLHISMMKMYLKVYFFNRVTYESLRSEWRFIFHFFNFTVESLLIKWKLFLVFKDLVSLTFRQFYMRAFLRNN